MMTDPIADMLSRIRNAVMIERLSVDIPHSNLKASLAAALQREGFIWDYEISDNSESPGKTIRMNLKYGPNGEKVIQKIRRISRPGLRKYNGVQQIQPVLNGLGVTILSTSQGVLSSREAKARNLGGEVLCEVW